MEESKEEGKREINIDGINKHNREMTENSEELKKEFIKIFSLYNDFDMPLDIAWNKFKSIVEVMDEDILPSDTEKIADLCIDVKKEYYSRDRGMIVDGEGNPKIKENIMVNSDFLKENPDIAAQINYDNKIVRELLKINDVEEIIKEVSSLNQSQRDMLREEIARSYEKSIESNEKKLEDIKRKRETGEITEEDIKIETELEQEYIKYIALIKLQAKFRGKNVEQLMKSKKISKENLEDLVMLSIDDDPKIQAFIATCLGNKINSKSMMQEVLLNLLNSYNKEPQTLDEVVKGREEHYRNQKKYKIFETKQVFKDGSKVDGKNKFKSMIIKLIEKRNRKYVKKAEAKNEEYEEEHILKDLKTDLEKKIYSEFRKINFKSNSSNPEIMIKLYLELEKGNLITDKSDPIQMQKVEAMKNVLKNMIFAPKNLGTFGRALYRDEKGELKINENALKSEKNMYKELVKRARVYISNKPQTRELSYDTKDTTLLTDMCEIFNKKRQISNRNSFIKYYIRNVEDENFNPDRRLEKIMFFEKVASSTKELSLFWENGSINFEKLKRYYNVLEKSEHDPKKENMENLIKSFSEINLGDLSEAEKEEQKKASLRNIFGKNSNYEEYSEKYKRYIQRYADINALETVYTYYTKEAEFDFMPEDERKEYLTQLLYLYKYKGDIKDGEKLSEKEKKESVAFKNIAAKLIKRDFSNIVLDKNGEINLEKFEKFCNTYIGNKEKGIVESKEKFLKASEKDLNDKLMNKGKTHIDIIDFDFDFDIEAIAEKMPDLKRKPIDKYIPKEEEKEISKIKLKDDSKKEQRKLNLVRSLNKLRNKEEKSHIEVVRMAAIERFILDKENRMEFMEYINENQVIGSEELEKILKEREQRKKEEEAHKRANKPRVKEFKKNLVMMINPKKTSSEIAKELNARNIEGDRTNLLSIFLTNGRIEGEKYFDIGKIEKMRQLISTISDSSGNQTIEGTKSIDEFIKRMTDKIIKDNNLRLYQKNFDKFIEDAKEIAVDFVPLTDKEFETVRIPQSEITVTYEQKRQNEVNKPISDSYVAKAIDTRGEELHIGEQRDTHKDKDGTEHTESIDTIHEEVSKTDSTHSKKETSEMKSDRDSTDVSDNDNASEGTANFEENPPNTFINVLKKGIQNIFNRTKTLPDPDNKDEKKPGLLKRLQDKFRKNEKKDRDETQSEIEMRNQGNAELKNTTESWIVKGDIEGRAIAAMKAKAAEETQMQQRGQGEQGEAKEDEQLYK